MRSGKLDRRITIRRPVQTGVDDLNAPVFTLQDVRTLWAERVNIKADEQFDPATKQRYAYSIATFRTRWFADLQSTDVVVSEGVTFNVKGSLELGRREGLEISCEEQK